MDIVIYLLTNLLYAILFFSSNKTSCRTWPWCVHFSLCRREQRSSLPPSPRSGSRPRRSGPAAAGEAGSPPTAAGPAPPPSTCWSPRTQTVTGKQGPRRAGRTTIKRRRRKRTRLPAPPVRPGWRVWDGSCTSLSGLVLGVRTNLRAEIPQGVERNFCLHPNPGLWGLPARLLEGWRSHVLSGGVSLSFLHPSWTGHRSL